MILSITSTAASVRSCGGPAGQGERPHGIGHRLGPGRSVSLHQLLVYLGFSQTCERLTSRVQLHTSASKRVHVGDVRWSGFHKPELFRVEQLWSSEVGGTSAMNGRILMRCGF